jgi:hypothetical protein
MSKHRKGRPHNYGRVKRDILPGRTFTSLDRPHKETPSIEEIGPRLPDDGTLLRDIPGSRFKKGDRIDRTNVREIGDALAQTPELRAIMNRYSDAEKLAAMEKLAKEFGGAGGDQLLDAFFAERPIGTVAESKHPNIKPGDTVHELTREELTKASPALALARDLMTADALLGTDSSTGDPRQIAVGFYLSLLRSIALDGGIGFQGLAIRGGDKYPECMEARRIDLAALDAMHNSIHASGPMTPKEHKQFLEMLHDYMGGLVFAKLREARIFQFKPRDYQTLYHLADVYTTMGAGYRWVPGSAAKRVPREEAEKVAVYTAKEGIAVPFPEKLPFSSCYFAWGTGVRPSRTLCHHYALKEDHFNLVMATLVSDDGWVWTFILKGNGQGEIGVGKNGQIMGGEPVVFLERIGHPSGKHTADGHEHSPLLNPGWCVPYTFAPWIVTYAVASIDRNDSLTRVQPGKLSERATFKTTFKRTRQQFLPPPYYTVIVQPSTYEEMEHQIESQPRDWSHRWDVRGHYGHRIMRGTLPLDPKLVYQLQKRKYEIFHALNRPSSEALAFLMRRRVLPPRDGEWLAYLRFHRDAFIKGPLDRPYIPSVHKLKGGVPEVV